MWYVHEALVGIIGTELANGSFDTEFATEAMAKRHGAQEKEADPTANWFTAVQLDTRPNAKERKSFILPVEKFVSTRKS